MNTPADQNTPDRIPGYATLQRASLGDYFAGVDLGEEQEKDIVARVILQDTGKMNPIVLQVSRIAMSLLPIGVLPVKYKAIYARQQSYPTLRSFVSNVADAMDLVAPAGVSFDTNSAQLRELLKQRAAYSTFRLLGMQMTNCGMDQRLVVGSFVVFLMDRTLLAVDRHLKSDKLSKTDRNRLLDDFAPALLALEEVLQMPVLRRDDLATRNMDLAEQLRQAKEDAQLADTQLKLRQKLVVSRPELFALAKRHMQATAQPKSGHAHHAATATSTDPANLPPPPGPRKIV